MKQRSSQLCTIDLNEAQHNQVEHVFEVILDAKINILSNKSSHIDVIQEFEVRTYDLNEVTHRDEGKPAAVSPQGSNHATSGSRARSRRRSCC